MSSQKECHWFLTHYGLSWQRLCSFQQDMFVRVRKKKHINFLELETILLFERKLAQRYQDVRYVMGADSQVALACLVKGKSSLLRLTSCCKEVWRRRWAAACTTTWGSSLLWPTWLTIRPEIDLSELQLKKSPRGLLPRWAATLIRWTSGWNDWGTTRCVLLSCPFPKALKSAPLR